MEHSRAAFVLVLIAACFTICHSRPSSIGNSHKPSLLHRQANESAGITEFQYSPSWFNTKSQASLWKSALKVSAETRELLFSPNSTILEDTLETNDASRLGGFLDQIFTGNLAGDEVRTRRSRRASEVADNEDPPDPIQFEEGRWRMGFSNYDQDGYRISSFVSTTFALVSYAQIGTDMIVNLRTPLSFYPYAGYNQHLFPPGSQREVSYMLQAPGPFFYEDVMMSLKLFISWTGSWLPEEERRVPSTSMAIEKMYTPMRVAQIAAGRFVVRGT